MSPVCRICFPPSLEEEKKSHRRHWVKVKTLEGDWTNALLVTFQVDQPNCFSTCRAGLVKEVYYWWEGVTCVNTPQVKQKQSWICSLNSNSAKTKLEVGRSWTKQCPKLVRNREKPSVSVCSLTEQTVSSSDQADHTAIADSNFLFLSQLNAESCSPSVIWSIAKGFQDGSCRLNLSFWWVKKCYKTIKFGDLSVRPRTAVELPALRFRAVSARELDRSRRENFNDTARTRLWEMCVRGCVVLPFCLKRSHEQLRLK